MSDLHTPIGQATHGSDATPSFSPAAAPRRSPWPIAISIGLALVVLANAAFVVLAVSGADPVVPSYRVEQR